ncbi:MAG TPA: alpha/beta fold hydrolase [Methylosinus sp.]
MTRRVFLPGAAGAAAFWRPVAELLRDGGEQRLLAWPGMGNQPADPSVLGMDDLVALTIAELEERSDVIAQSMGGLIAILAAVAAPSRIRRLVLTAASVGLPVEELGAVDWRPDYRKRFPRAASWIEDPIVDVSAHAASIRARVLLIWGDRDPISPVAVGEYLRGIFPDARLHVVQGGDHDIAITHAGEVANLIRSHLSEG